MTNLMKNTIIYFLIGLKYEAEKITWYKVIEYEIDENAKMNIENLATSTNFYTTGLFIEQLPDDVR